MGFKNKLPEIDNDTWNLIVTTLSYKGGYIVTNRNTSEVVIFIKRLNNENKMKNVFKKFLINTKDVAKLKNDIFNYREQVYIMEEERRKEREQESLKNKTTSANADEKKIENKQ
jgi:hypothetical protein